MDIGQTQRYKLIAWSQYSVKSMVPSASAKVIGQRDEGTARSDGKVRCADFAKTFNRWNPQ